MGSDTYVAQDLDQLLSLGVLAHLEDRLLDVRARSAHLPHSYKQVVRLQKLPSQP